MNAEKVLARKRAQLLKLLGAHDDKDLRKIHTLSAETGIKVVFSGTHLGTWAHSPGWMTEEDFRKWLWEEEKKFLIELNEKKKKHQEPAKKKEKKPNRLTEWKNEHREFDRQDELYQYLSRVEE